MNCFYLGIDDSAKEGTYVYTSNNNTVDSGLKSEIVVNNECGTGCEYGHYTCDCDHLYTCYHATNVIYTVYTVGKMTDLVCEYNVNANGGMQFWNITQ